MASLSFTSGTSENELPWWNIDAYDYDLPAEYIAQHPAPERDCSRLLVYNGDSRSITHHVFHELPDMLEAGDALVLNDCRVIPARLYARRSDTGTEVEVLLTRQREDTVWEAMVKPGRSCRPGTVLDIDNTAITVLDVMDDGQRVLRFECSLEAIRELLETKGVMPLPPYIERDRTPSTSEDRERYQTVYAREGRAIAAPTAGLHFTHELLERLTAAGITMAMVRLDVGIGTFQPVKTNDLRQHHMHEEYCQLPGETAEQLNDIRARGSRIIVVGTTSLRVLESSLDPEGYYKAFEGATDIFIHPPNHIRSADGLITNFHLPKSTLLMLVAAWTGGTEWRRIYEAAIHEGYRFYSYGDSMLLL
jgi:S-adenosylmethionine:tRNA ribosyltransferase-isomerase